MRYVQKTNRVIESVTSSCLLITLNIDHFNYNIILFYYVVLSEDFLIGLRFVVKQSIVVGNAIKTCLIKYSCLCHDRSLILVQKSIATRRKFFLYIPNMVFYPL